MRALPDKGWDPAKEVIVDFQEILHPRRSAFHPPDEREKLYPGLVAAANALMQEETQEPSEA